MRHHRSCTLDLPPAKYFFENFLGSAGVGNAQDPNCAAKAAAEAFVGDAEAGREGGADKNKESAPSTQLPWTRATDGNHKLSRTALQHRRGSSKGADKAKANSVASMSTTASFSSRGSRATVQSSLPSEGGASEVRAGYLREELAGARKSVKQDSEQEVLRVRRYKGPNSCSSQVSGARFEPTVVEEEEEKVDQGPPLQYQLSDTDLAVRLHIKAKDLEGSNGAFRDAHVEFEERRATVHAVDRAGRTWTFATCTLPGPIITEESRFSLSKTGEVLHITLTKCDGHADKWWRNGRIVLSQKNLAPLRRGSTSSPSEVSQEKTQPIERPKDKMGMQLGRLFI